MDDNNNQQNQAAKDKVALYDFVAELLNERKDMQLTSEEKPLVIEQLVKELDYTINAHLMDLLSDEAVDKFNTLLDSNPTGEQINEFLSNHIPNLSTEVAAAMIEFRTVFLFEEAEDQVTTNTDSEVASQEAPHTANGNGNGASHDYQRAEEVQEQQDSMVPPPAPPAEDPQLN